MPLPQGFEVTDKMHEFAHQLAHAYSDMGLGHIREAADIATAAYGCYLAYDSTEACIGEDPTNKQSVHETTEGCGLNLLLFVTTLLAVNLAQTYRAMFQTLNNVSPSFNQTWNRIGGKALQAKLVQLESQYRHGDSFCIDVVKLLIEYFSTHHYVHGDRASSQALYEFLYDQEVFTQALANTHWYPPPEHNIDFETLTRALLSRCQNRHLSDDEPVKSITTQFNQWTIKSEFIEDGIKFNVGDSKPESNDEHQSKSAFSKKHN